MQVLGISFDTVEKNAKFAANNSFPFPLLSDTKREVGVAYGACDSPKAWTAKRITYVIGPDGKVAQFHGKVNAAKHPEELLYTL